HEDPRIVRPTPFRVDRLDQRLIKCWIADEDACRLHGDEGAVDDRSVGPVLDGRGPDDVLEGIRPGRHVGPPGGLRLGNKRIEERTLDVRVLGIAERVKAPRPRWPCIWPRTPRYPGRGRQSRLSTGTSGQRRTSPRYRRPCSSSGTTRMKRLRHRRRPRTRYLVLAPRFHTSPTTCPVDVPSVRLLSLSLSPCRPNARSLVKHDRLVKQDRRWAGVSDDTGWRERPRSCWRGTWPLLHLL